MIPKRRLIIISVSLFLTSIIATTYMVTVLSLSETYGDNIKPPTVQDQILYELEILNVNHLARIKKNLINHNITLAVNNLKAAGEIRIVDPHKVWAVANSWVTNKQVIQQSDPRLPIVLHALKNAPIVKADLDTRGTQLKLLLTLQGDQQVVFKPQWYSVDHVIDGPVYAGKDRYGSEILGFYLSVLLEKPVSPASVERRISLRDQVMPVATQRLKKTSYTRNNQTCVYGKCFYCKKEEPVCEPFNSSITGAVIFNIRGSLKSYRSPWQRTYKKGKRALWEDSEDFCRTAVLGHLSNKRIYELTDAAIVDFLLQNGDRHHYETLNGGPVLLLDQGKGLGNPHIHHLDILAPLYQCCMLKTSTWRRLILLTGGTLTDALEKMPDIHHILTPHHFRALDQRLLLVLAAVEYCRKKNNLLNFN